jgi:hypothetical protein
VLVPPPVQQPDRDLAIYRAWVDGARQVELAERYQVTPSAISHAISRAVAMLPEQDRAEEVRRTLDLVDDLIAVYAPKARNGNHAANREVRGLIALRIRAAGIDRREVEHTGTVEHHHQVQVPTVPELLDRWRAEGKVTIRGEPTRVEP